MKLIAEQVAELIPDRAVLQLGIGAIPTAVADCLYNKKGIKIFGMGIDSMVDLVEKGVIEPNRSESELPPIVACEFLGTQKLFRFIDDNPMVEGRAIPDSINTLVTAGISNFVSIQSAIEVDLYGLVNVETIGERFVSGLGGSHDLLLG